MDKNHNNIDKIYFVFSGIFAIFLYVLILFILLILFRTNQSIELSIKNPSKISSIEIDLVNDVLEKNPKIVEKKDISKKDSNDETSNSKKSGSKSPIAGIGASDLFKKVDTAKPNINTKDDLSDNRDAIALNKKGEEANINKNDKLNKILQSTQNLAQTIQSLNQSISIEDTNTSIFCTTYKDYCNKLAELLYSNWDIRNSFDEILTSVVVIKISKSGDFSYTIKKLSNNTIFDIELKESLEKLRNIKFPTLDGVKFDKLEVIFRNKKEN